jgi:hypothetical protein
MAGSYDPNNPPVRRGFYSRILAAVEQAISGGSGGVVAIPIIHDSGPIGTPVEITSMREFDEMFGNTATDDRLAVKGALAGTGASNSGASAVIVYRMDITGQAAASRTFQNTGSTNALTLTAKYKGTRGNGLRVTIRNHPTDSSKDQLLIYDDTTLVETFSYTDANVADLAAQVNNSVTGSDYVTATSLVSGTALGTVTTQALNTVAGANGTVAAGDYSDAQTDLESQPFNIYVMPNMTDATTLIAARAWIQSLNTTARRVLMVEAGGAAETLSDAIARSALTASDANFVNMGYNKFKELETGNVYSSAQMVGYLAGIIAGVGVTGSITFARLSGFDLAYDAAHPGLSLGDIEDAINGGVVIFSKDGKGIRIEAEVTTFTNKADVNLPYDVFSSIKSVRTMHQIENDLTEITEEEWIGKVVNTEATRDNYLGMLLSYFQRLEAQGALKVGMSDVRFDETQDNTGNTLYPIYRVEMASAIERVLAIGQVS